jgi:hypothetical protein
MMFKQSLAGCTFGHVQRTRPKVNNSSVLITKCEQQKLPPFSGLAPLQASAATFQ